jgi:hypothetical protein
MRTRPSRDLFYVVAPYDFNRIQTELSYLIDQAIHILWSAGRIKVPKICKSPTLYARRSYQHLL